MTILLILVMTVTSVLLVGCGKEKEEKKAVEKVEATESVTPTTVQKNEDKKSEIDGNTKEIDNLDIDSQVVKYNGDGSEFDIYSLENEKIIYNKNNVVIESESLNKQDDYVQMNLFVENKNETGITFSIESLIINDTMAFPIEKIQAIAPKNKEKMDISIHVSQLYESHVSHINNIYFIIKIDSNNYEKENVVDENKVIRDETKFIAIKTNSKLKTTNTKEYKLFSNELMDISLDALTFNGCIFKVTNKSDGYLRVKISNIIIAKDKDDPENFYKSDLTLPKGKFGYIKFSLEEYEMSKNGIVNEWKKNGLLEINFNVNTDAADSEIKIFNLKMKPKK